MRIEGIEFLGVTIKFDMPIDRSLYDFGSVKLVCDDRQFILNVCMSYTNSNRNEIECDLEVDTESFPINEYQYDITAVDLMLDRVKGTMYIGCEYEEDPTSITLFVKHLNCIKAIELNVE